MAAEKNPELLARYADYEAALQQVPQVSSLPDPQWSFGYFPMPIQTRNGRQLARTGLQQMFPWFGTLAAREDAASQRAVADFQVFIDVRNALFRSVKVAYYDLYELERSIAFSEENLLYLASLERLARTQFAAGTGALVDVLRAQVQQEEALTQLAILREKRRPLKAVFNSLLNRPLQDSVQIEDVSTLTDTLLWTEATGLDSLDNPKLRALDAQQEAARADEQVAIKEGFPSMGIGVDYVVMGAYPPSVEVPAGNGMDMVMPMVSMTLPLNRKKYRASQQQAQARQAALARRRESTVNELRTQWEQAQFTLVQARRQAALYQRLTQKVQQEITLLRTTYSAAGSDFEEILRAQQQLLDYQLKLVSAQRARWVSQADLDYIVGQPDVPLTESTD